MPQDVRSNRRVVNGIWVAAAVIVLAGFILRSLSSLFANAGLRYSGIAVIAVGLAVALVGWVGERVIARRAS